MPARVFKKIISIKILYQCAYWFSFLFYLPVGALDALVQVEDRLSHTEVVESNAHTGRELQTLSRERVTLLACNGRIRMEHRRMGHNGFPQSTR
jgi:hypothetical protein